jgi:signal transduction histidine kinase
VTTRLPPLLTDLLEALPEPALLFDERLRLTATNEAGRALLELRDEPYTPSQALGTARVADLVDEAVAAARSVRMETVLDGRDLEVIAAPVGDHTLVLLRDQTDRQRVDAVRRDFVANASHEMKTPVAGIQALADALTVTIEHGEHDRSRELTERLTDEADRLGRLITELLSLRRLEEDGERARTPVDLATVVAEEVERIGKRAASRGIHVASTLPGSAVVAGSEGDLRLIVSNLLDNAVGYNRDKGRIEVELSPHDGAWRLRVADTGIGIPRQDLDRIFERFYRVDVARSRAAGGTGLGLSIVRHAAERHGGSVHVTSILGEGTSFTVTLPVQPPTAPQAPIR